MRPMILRLSIGDFDVTFRKFYTQGLITGRTYEFLVDPQRPDMAAKIRVATGLSHEIAHMWSMPTLSIPSRIQIVLTVVS